MSDEINISKSENRANFKDPVNSSKGKVKAKVKTRNETEVTNTYEDLRDSRSHFYIELQNKGREIRESNVDDDLTHSNAKQCKSLKATVTGIFLLLTIIAIGLISNFFAVKESYIQLRIKEFEAEIARLQDNQSETLSQMYEFKQIIDKCKQTSACDKRSTYIRWGRKLCPSSGSELVYAGLAASGHRDNLGSAAELFCLPSIYPAIETNFGCMVGVILERIADEQEILCAVCRTHHATSLMIPGTRNCYDGWKREYFGHLAPLYYKNNATSSYMCIDDNPGIVLGRATKTNFGESLVIRRNLKCPLVPCVVCSK